MRRLFSIGKVIQIRIDDPLKVKQLAFVETEEHIRHVTEMLNWLYPHASDTLRRVAELHDIGKKVYLQREFARSRGRWDKRLTQDKLRADFYGNLVLDTFMPIEAISRYLEFIEGGTHVKCFLLRQKPQENDSPIVAVRYQLDPPFGNHAASVELEDLQGVPNSELSYVHSLIQLHHNFQVDKLVTTAAQHGEGIIADLYSLMTADQEGSRWAEYVVQKLEKGQETPQGKFGFSEFAVEPVAEPTEISRSNTHVRGQVTLRATRRPDLGERALTVDYYVSGCDLNPDKFLSAKRKGGRKK